MDCILQIEGRINPCRVDVKIYQGKDNAGTQADQHRLRPQERDHNDDAPEGLEFVRVYDVDAGKIEGDAGDLRLSDTLQHVVLNATKHLVRQFELDGDDEATLGHLHGHPGYVVIGFHLYILRGSPAERCTAL